MWENRFKITYFVILKWSLKWQAVDCITHSWVFDLLQQKCTSTRCLHNNTMLMRPYTYSTVKMSLSYIYIFDEGHGGQNEDWNLKIRLLVKRWTLMIVYIDSYSNRPRYRDTEFVLCISFSEFSLDSTNTLFFWKKKVWSVYIFYG